MTMTNHYQTGDRQAAFLAAQQALRQRLAGLGAAAPSADADTSAVPPLQRALTPRQRRSLNTCHRPAPDNRKRLPFRSGGMGYVPEVSARIEDDPNLTDGARRCARKIAELTYRSHRESRSLPVTVTYLAKALGRCRRTVQRYLRQLEREGYVAVEVVASRRSRMCIGLVVRLLEPLLAAHHRDCWPGTLGSGGATPKSQNKRTRFNLFDEGPRLGVEQWALRCMEGVFRAFMETHPLPAMPSLPSTA